MLCKLLIVAVGLLAQHEGLRSRRSTSEAAGLTSRCSHFSAPQAAAAAAPPFRADVVASCHKSGCVARGAAAAAAAAVATVACTRILVRVASASGRCLDSVQLLHLRHTDGTQQIHEDQRSSRCSHPMCTPCVATRRAGSSRVADVYLIKLPASAMV